MCDSKENYKFDLGVKGSTVFQRIRELIAVISCDKTLFGGLRTLYHLGETPSEFSVNHLK